MPLSLAAADITSTVTDGPFLIAALLSVAAGVVSFASPCVLPLVPGYLSYLVGLVGAEGADSTSGSARGSRADPVVRTRAVRGALLFVVGFTVVFLAQSLLVLGIASTLLQNAELLTRIGGVITVVMGLVMLGFVRPLQREARIHARPKGRVVGALLLGAIFALGWTVCLGPTLSGVLSLAVSTDWNGNAWRGLGLVVLYCLGLGVPFLLLAFGFGWATSAVTVLRRHTRTIQVIGGTLLIVLGLLMVTGLWGEFIAFLRGRFAGTETLL
jgi:cytochrome c-type biogenesis protein